MHLEFKHRKIVILSGILFLLILHIDIYAQKTNHTESLIITQIDTIQSIASLEENPVLYIQQNLNQLGYQVPENNILDISTKKALTDFLKTQGVPVHILNHGGNGELKKLFEFAIKEYKN